MEKISISCKNIKMNGAGSISFPAGITCAPGVPCAGKCYALKMERLRPSVSAAWARNLRAYRQDPAGFLLQAAAGARAFRFFRWFVGGDIPDPAFLGIMRDVAALCPETRFLAFSKRADWINADISARGPLPDNLAIVLSYWPGYAPENPHNLPTSHVLLKDGTTTAPHGAVYCSGSCSDCLDGGHHCWKMRAGDAVVFREH